MSQLKCIVVTPEKTVLETKADFVVLPLFDGEIGIAAGRAPMIGRLGYGQMRVKLGDKVQRYYLDGGFVQVSGGVVSVLTNSAIPADDVDVEAARIQLETGLGLPIHTTELEGIRDRKVAQARARIRIGRAT